MNLHIIDLSIIGFYFVMMLVTGIWSERRARKSLRHYFLADKTVPWWMLGMSGSTTSFDITGTMWMVSVFYLLGMRGMWEHLFWCFPIAGFMMAFKAKWAYRSGTLTVMEWLVFRFGRGRAGEAARFISVVLGLTVLVLMLGYAGTGVGKFVEEIFQVRKTWGVPLLFGLTGLYVILGGFVSVVFTELLQTVLLSFAAVYIAVLAFVKIDPEVFRQTVGDGWFDVVPVWRLDHPPADYAAFPFGLFILLWSSKCLIALFSGSGGIDFQRFRAARNEGEACKIGLAWGLVFSVRFGLVIGFTALGLTVLAGEGAAKDPDRVLPIMMDRLLSVGVKGVIIAALLAAFMSTFNSQVNLAASFIVNDLIKPVWKRATPRALVIASYISTAAVIGMGVLVSMHVDRIRDIWNPINFALGAALVAPGLLAPYWYRVSGWSLCFSGACTIPAACGIYFLTDWHEIQYFPVLCGVSLASCVVGSYLLPRAPDETLMIFYQRVRPWGAWGYVRRKMIAAGLDAGRPERDRWDIPVAIVATVFYIIFYLCVMDVVVHNWGRALWLAIGSAACGLFLYVFWWRRLPTTDLVAELPGPET